MVPLVSIPLPDAVRPPACESLDSDYITASRLTSHGLRENEAQTGTRYSTLVTIAVKAVPLNWRE
jgi:hypothetical protein